MAKWLYNGHASPVAQNETRYFGISGEGVWATEPEAQVRIRQSYTASNLWCNVTQVSGTCTLTARKNGGAGNLTISITTTGTKEDTTHTDSLVTGDLYAYQAVVSNSHNNNCTMQTVSVLLDDGGSNAPLVGAFGSGNGLGNSTFGTIMGFCSGDATEANTKILWRAAATLSRLRVYLVSNAGSNTVTFRSRINGVNGNQSVTFGIATSGEQEDSTNSDTVAAGDSVNFSVSGVAAIQPAVVQVLTASAARPALCCRTISGQGSGALGASATRYAVYDGDLGLLVTTESNAQVKTRVVDVFKNMQCNVIQNSRSDATTCDFRAGAASPSGGPAISVAAAATGIKEDLTGTYTSATTDLINYRILTGAGTGTITLTTLGAQQGSGTIVSSSIPGGMTLLRVGN